MFCGKLKKKYRRSVEKFSYLRTFCQPVLPYGSFLRFLVLVSLRLATCSITDLFSPETPFATIHVLWKIEKKISTVRGEIQLSQNFLPACVTLWEFSKIPGFGFSSTRNLFHNRSFFPGNSFRYYTCSVEN